MGNTSSAPNSSTENSNIKTLPYLIDEIAMHYMITQNAIDLEKITNPEYHDKLIILTSGIIEKRLNNLEIGYLKNRIVGNNDEIQDIMPANSKLKDKIVTDISKYYVKILMIYSSIVATFDPQYSYTDEGGTKTFYLKDHEFENIPEGVTPTLVQLTNPMSLCRKRLNILKNRYDETTEPGSVILNPGEKLCSTESTVKLTDELGMKELDALYYDIFDYNTKKWSKRSNKMKKKYNKDLILFYRIYTGNRTKPANIKSFQDIELLDFKTLNSCSDNNFLSDIVVSKENKLIKDYKEKIDLIQNITEENRKKFYDILKEIFVIKTVDNEVSYTINPSLTMDKILLLEEQTRNALLDLYISCEKYFIQALIIFENIYESKDYTISEYRKENLMNIPPPPTPINYKDSLTITPPFSPNIQPSIEPMNVTQNITQNINKDQVPLNQSPQPEKPGMFDFFKKLTSSEKSEPVPTPSNPESNGKTTTGSLDAFTSPPNSVPPNSVPPNAVPSNPPSNSVQSNTVPSNTGSNGMTSPQFTNPTPSNSVPSNSVQSNTTTQPDTFSFTSPSNAAPSNPVPSNAVPSNPPSNAGQSNPGQPNTAQSNELPIGQSNATTQPDTFSFRSPSNEVPSNPAPSNEVPSNVAQTNTSTQSDPFSSPPSSNPVSSNVGPSNSVPPSEKSISEESDQSNIQSSGQGNTPPSNTVSSNAGASNAPSNPVLSNAGPSNAPSNPVLSNAGPSNAPSNPVSSNPVLSNVGPSNIESVSPQSNVNKKP